MSLRQAIAVLGVGLMLQGLPALAAPEIEYSRFQLDNGLTVVVHEDHKTPVVAVGVWYHVGSADEPTGKTGFAHLFEHLMFSGSENYRDGYFRPFEQVGASDMNGTTWLDRTNYYETVPTTALDRALWLESDRMGHLLGAIGQKELDTQRGVVQNEKREGENEPYGRSDALIQRNLFPANHPYHHDTIGSMDDLDAASLTDVRQWFQDYYGAANTTLVLAGDITLEQAKVKVERYFGDIPAGKPMPRQQPWVIPLAQSRQGVQHDQVAQATLMRSWVAPPLDSDDILQLGLAARVLGQGKTSRLYQRLVVRERLASEVSASVEPFALASRFTLSVDLLPGVSRALVDAVLADEWRKFLASGPSADELARAKMNNYSAYVRSLESVSAKAAILAQGQLYFGDPLAFSRQLERSQAASIASVRGAAAKWLSRGAFTLTVLPAGENFDAEREDRAQPSLGAAPGRPLAQTGPARAERARSGALDRSAGLPRVDQFPDLSFPPLQRARLDNGIEVILAERYTVPTTQVQLLFNAGYAADHGRKLGSAAFATEMLGESTRRRSSLQLAQERQRLGALIGTNCGLDSCELVLDALNEQRAPSLALLAEMVREPAFKSEDIENLRSAWLAGIAQEKTQPRAAALRVLPPLLYGKDHAYGASFTGSGSEDSIRALTRRDLERFQRDFLRPDNLRILVSGAASLAEIVPELNAVFGDWRPAMTPVPSKNLSQVAPPTHARVFLLDRPGASQTLIVAGLIAPPANASDVVDLGLANDVLGGTFSSRLNMNLREDKHWAYGAHSGLGQARGQRPMLISAPVQTDKTAAAMSEMLKEARAVVNERPLTASEIEQVKLQRTRALPAGFSSNASVLQALADNARYGRADDYVTRLKSQLLAVDTGSAQTALKRVLRPDALTWVIVGDLSKIEAPVRALNLGPVAVIDGDGRPQDSKVEGDSR